MVIIVLFNFRHGPPRGMPPGIVENMKLRTKYVAQMVTESVDRNENIDKIKIRLSEIGVISRLHLTLFDSDGKIIYETEWDKPGQFNFGAKPEVRLSQAEIERIKNGETFCNERNEKDSAFYSICPVYSDNTPSGAVMASMQFGAPPPPDNLRRQFDNLLIRSIILAIIIVSIAAFFLARNFTNPIRSMVEAAKNITQGDFSHKMNSKRDDELGILSNTLDEMSTKIEKSIKGRMQLIADISHELMTPLTSIQGCTEAIIDGVVTEKAKIDKYLGIILNQAKRLSLLKNDLINLSRFEYGEIRVQSKPFPISFPADEAVESAQFMANKKDANVRTEVKDKNISVLGDQDRILQVIQNLLNNAIHHNPPGTQVLLSVTNDENCVTYLVEDNGRGIPPEELENIFERFYKVDKSREKGDSLAGLGLAIASEIIKAHNSKINVSSSEKGSKFWFNLPIAK